jgi:hypothetical protein
VPDATEREHLAARFVEGEISSQEASAILEECESNEAFLDELADQVTVKRLLQHEGLSGDAIAFVSETVKRLDAVSAGEEWMDGLLEKVEARPRHAVRRRKRRIPWGVWISVAACMAIIIGSVTYNYRQAEKLPEKIVARVMETNTNVTIRRGDEIGFLLPGDILLPGDRIEAGPREEMTFGYDGQETTVRMTERTALSIGPVDKGIRIDLLSGEIDCDVSPQPSRRPMTVVTPNAKAVVEGTRFLISALPASTTLEVNEGVVALVCLSDGSSVKVAAGQCVTAGAGPLTVKGQPSVRELVDDLVRKAAGAKTVADIKALRGLARRAFREELEKGTECRLSVLFGLGLASAITGNPKLDRQADDLRFALGSVSKSISSGVDAAIAPEERARLAADYVAARRAARQLYYDDWCSGTEKLAKRCMQERKLNLADALGMEIMYVEFYECGMPTHADDAWRTCPESVRSLPGHRYFESSILPAMKAMLARDRALEQNIVFDRKVRKMGGKWEIVKRGTQGAPYHTISQTQLGGPSNALFLRGTSFNEAVLTFQDRGKRPEGAKPTGSVWAVGIHDLSRGGVNFKATGCYGLRVRVWQQQKRWVWARVYINREKNGDCTFHTREWVAGTQPYDLRGLKNDDLPELPRHFRPDNPTLAVSQLRRYENVGRPSLVFITGYGFAARWRALGLEILKK